MRKLLLIYNPNSGTRKSAKNLSSVVELLTKKGWEVTCMPTLGRGDGTKYAEELGAMFEAVVVMGGDGTYNEVVAGVMKLDKTVPVGYIPAGSTNDFASSMKLPKDIMEAAEVAVDGRVDSVDIGLFNNRVFTYVASFGAFTKATYVTPQNFKNLLGHTAYILSGITSLAEIKPIYVRIETEGREFKGDYIFGAVSNSTSMGGILKINPDDVDMSDGRFELLLIKFPKDLIELGEIVNAITQQNYESTDMLVFVEGSEFKFTLAKEVDWSLDGEFQKGASTVIIENKKQAINIMVPQNTTEKSLRLQV